MSVESGLRRPPSGGEEDSVGRLLPQRRTVEKPSAIFQTDSEGFSASFSGTEDVRHIGVDTPKLIDPEEEVEPYCPEAPAFAMCSPTRGRTATLVEKRAWVERVWEQRKGNECNWSLNASENCCETPSRSRSET